MDEAAAVSAGDRPVGDRRLVEKVPVKATPARIPVDFGIGGMSKRDLAQMRFRQGNETTRATIARQKPGLALKCCDFCFQRDQ
jgi:hypothetical protein